MVLGVVPRLESNKDGGEMQFTPKTQHSHLEIMGATREIFFITECSHKALIY